MVHVRVGQRVSPLVPLGDGQRQRRVEDRGQRVDERHLRPGIPANSSRRHVGHRTDQQAARAAAERDEVLRPGHVGVDEMRCDGDEVGEGVLLLQQLAVLVPRPAQLAAAAHVRDGEHHAAVEQRQPGDGEPRVLARFVGPVAVQQRRRRELQAGAVDDRHRHPRAVVGDRPVAPLDVVLGAVVAEHRLFAQQRPLAGRRGRRRRCAPG